MPAALTITSRANPRFKALRALLAPGGPRRGHTLILGEKLVDAWREAPAIVRDRFRPVTWLRLEGAEPHPLEGTLAPETLVLGEGLMRDLAEAGSPPRHALLAAVGPDPAGPLAARVIVPWGIQDPGNLGAILRSAAAFGFQEALLGPQCADPFSPRALRGSMGAAFLLPVRRTGTLDPYLEPGQPGPGDGGRWLALDGGPGALPLAEADLGDPLRILVGNEGHGWQGADLPPGVRRVAIPIRGVESLNAAVAAGIACFETARRAALAPLRPADRQTHHQADRRADLQADR
jgi:TrmH family RNA methyltransferase